MVVDARFYVDRFDGSLTDTQSSTVYRFLDSRAPCSRRRHPTNGNLTPLSCGMATASLPSSNDGGNKRRGRHDRWDINPTGRTRAPVPLGNPLFLYYGPSPACLIHP